MMLLRPINDSGAATIRKELRSFRLDVGVGRDECERVDFLRVISAMSKCGDHIGMHTTCILVNVEGFLAPRNAAFSKLRHERNPNICLQGCVVIAALHVADVSRRVISKGIVV